MEISSQHIAIQKATMPTGANKVLDKRTLARDNKSRSRTDVKQLMSMKIGLTTQVYP